MASEMIPLIPDSSSLCRVCSSQKQLRGLLPLDCLHSSDVDRLNWKMWEEKTRSSCLLGCEACEFFPSPPHCTSYLTALPGFFVLTGLAEGCEFPVPMYLLTYK